MKRSLVFIFALLTLTLPLKSHSLIFMGSVYTGPCDLVSGPTAWWGLRACGKANLTGTQKAINITRASDSTSTDILILSNGKLDVATASAFCNATTCSVGIFYDQSGNGINVTQPTAALQPTLTFNCQGNLPCVNFNNCTTSNTSCPSTILLTSATITAIPQPLTISVVAQRTAGATYNQAPIDSTGGQAGIYFGSTSGTVTLYNGNSATFFNTTEGAIHALNGTMSDSNSSSNLNIDGTDNALTLGGTNGTSTSLTLGAQGDQFQHLTGNVWEGGFWPIGFSSAQRINMANNQRAYYGF